MAATSGTDSQSPIEPFTVKLGRTEVRIYPRAADRGRKAGFFVADYSTGKRRLRWFTDEGTAKAEAARIAARMNAGDHAGAAFTGDERRDFMRATEFVAPFKIDVPTACQVFAQAAELVGVDAIVAACKAFARRSPATRKALPLRQAIADLIQSKHAKGRSNRLLEDLRSRLGRFASDHEGVNLGDITTGSVQHWLDRLTGTDGKPLARQTKKNFATVLHGLFEHHRRRGAIQDNPCGDLEREATGQGGDVIFWAPEEAAALLASAPREVLAGLVLAMFTGCRSAEVTRLRWSDIDLDQGHVVISATSAKTASRRLTPIPPNAIAWLRPLMGAPGSKIFNGHETRFPKLVSHAARTAGVRRIANGARHTAITFKVALTGDVSRIALESGNSPAVVHRYYRGLSTAADAKRFFSIMPPAK
jgi:integrase